MERFRCPCCGFFTFGNKPTGTFEICQVCYWEDDQIQNEDPEFDGGANDICLSEARKNFEEFGAVKAEYVKLVREPYESEKP